MNDGFILQSNGGRLFDQHQNEGMPNGDGRTKPTPYKEAAGLAPHRLCLLAGASGSLSIGPRDWLRCSDHMPLTHDIEPGERLPDQEDVALGLSVSPITARRALAILAEQGVVVRRRGRAGGTFVADSPPTEVLASLSASPAESQAVNRLGTGGCCSSAR